MGIRDSYRSAVSAISLTVELFEFSSLGETAVGRLYIPTHHDGPHPAVVTAPAFGGVKEMLLPEFASALASSGIACLIFDYIGFGDSGGELRQEVSPLQQVQTFRDALTALEQDSRINPKELGVLGISLSGGHALYAAATDRRVKAVVACTPFISPTAGVGGRMNLGPKLWADTFLRVVLKRQPKIMVQGVGPPGSKAVLTTDGVLEWTDTLAMNAPNFHNEVTVSSLANLLPYNIAPHAAMIRVPTLAIAAKQDRICPASNIHKALDKVRGATVHEFYGSHFELLGKEFPRVIDLTIDWFTMHLREWKTLAHGSW